MSKYTQKERGGLYELTDAARAELIDSKYYNKDLSPTSLSERNWSTYHIAALWIGMSVCLPSFAMASSLVGLGLSPWLAVLNVALGNVIVLVPIQMNSHAGTKYGIPFPVFARMTFGAVGAHIPALSRAITACGWNAIQSWIGGAAIVSLIAVFVPSFKDLDSAQYIGFFLFLAAVCLVAARGAHAIRLLEAISAPVLIALTVGLFVWSLMLANGGGFGFADVIRAKTNYGLVADNGGLLYVFLGGLTANIAFWATMALNIPDFSRYAVNQKAQFRGQLYGMPLAMTVCAFVGAFFAQATSLVGIVNADGSPVFDPTVALNHLPYPALTFIVAIGVLVATITTDIAANVVAPANGFSNISPKRISYAFGVVISCVIAVLYQPWNIFGGAAAYIFDWLNVYGGILAPIAAIFIADYYVVKKRNVDVRALYQGTEGRYWYRSGWNLRAIVAWVCGFILPTLGGTVLKGNVPLSWISANGYIIGFIIGFAVYVLLMKSESASLISDEEAAAITER
ncbi:MAG: NCS1 family nucleobase:cation symporter-1 [Clostridiales Family XIII bacterium]|jgi:NCS1 family nucleobase:cation symporter-1|nr:NCS1 family nucleobase:cation symporter-1 [Clostridiales Family XIII bacterium]